MNQPVRMTNEQFSQAMREHVTPPPLNERVTAIGPGEFVTEDDHGTMRFYSGWPLQDMPRQLTA